MSCESCVKWAQAVWWMCVSCLLWKTVLMTKNGVRIRSLTALPQMTLSFFKPYRSPRWHYCDIMTKQNKTQQWARGGHLRYGDMDNWSVLWLRGNNRKSRWWPLLKRHNWCVYKSGFGPSQGPSSGAFNAVLRELGHVRKLTITGGEPIWWSVWWVR